MSYQIQANEKLPQGIKRIGLEQIDQALSYLRSPGDDLDKAVHESRKCFKKLRGLLRLVRKEIGEEIYQRENKTFRDAGRLLSDLRDSAVRIKTLDTLIENSGLANDDDSFLTMRQTLVIFYNATHQRVIVEEQALPKTIAVVQSARTRVNKWPVETDSFTAVAGGLRKIYKRGRNRFEDAAAVSTSEAFHEWRKRVKYLWYSMRLLQSIWPEPMAVLADEIHDLSDYLGDANDLAELLKIIENQPKIINDNNREIISYIDNKQTALQEQAFQQGEFIYAELPDLFISRMNTYWEATRR
jgi:CHAD domain-containing protein